MSQKTVLITGTTSGIGEATAHLFAENNYRIILNGRRNDRLEKQAKELEAKYNCSTYLMHADVRDNDAVIAFFNQLPENWQNIDVLVNNAGLAAGLEGIEDGDIDNWNRMIDTNVKGLLYVTKAMIPLLKKTKGHIVNIGSIAGKEVYPNGNVYCGTKHMVDALNKAMRRELAEAGIKVSSVNPGAVETEFSIVRLDGDEEKAKNVYEGFENLMAQDIADAIWYVVSRPRHVNINELIIMPTAQPAAGTVIKNKGL
ncbi:MAG: SDR family NAD(P)-dependent oxidoreductase [Bacteroidia bacterium]|nr:SDR family NAD(P)-dependent oxidoreductase [Bacteroidia bacterium]NNJ54660.1 SDR family NAD(P)-dependent oxidoreductase [Bacteroidia bacterium]